MKKSAKGYALWLLSKRDYFVDEIRDKLYRKGYSQEEIEEAIKYLIEEGYLNDEELKERYKERFLEKGKSSYYIRKKLFSKGFKGEIEISFEDELKSALYLLRFKYKKGKNYKDIVKFLSYRGFSYDIIQEAYRTFVEEG